MLLRANPDRRPLAAHVWTKDALRFYIEPEWCSDRLFAAKRFAGTICNRACGVGRIAEAARRVGYRVIATELIDRGYRRFDGVVDFLHCKRRLENVVSNPPFQVCNQFVRHALKLTAGKVAMIWLVRRLNAARWLQELPLCCVYFLTPRPSMPPGHVIATGEKPEGGTQDFCWLVFEHGHLGAPELRWLRREP